MEELRIGFALCGSFCTFSKVLPALEALAAKYPQVIPIMSEAARSTDTRFGECGEIVRRVEAACGRSILRTIAQAEPIGPRGLLDVLVVAPCTGNTLAKLAAGVTDSVVTMACKAQLRNDRPVVLALATNDALSGNAKNIGALLERRNIYFVPFGQDDPEKKPASLVADMTKIEPAMLLALEGRQLQPLLI